MTMIWLLLDALGTVLAWLLDGVLALVDLISPGWDEGEPDTLTNGMA